MRIDQVHFYVKNAQQWRNWFVDCLGFRALVSGQTDPYTSVEVVASGQIEFVLWSALSPTSTVADYLKHHPPGVVDVTFRVNDLEGAMAKALEQGAKVLQPIQQLQGSQGCLKWSQIAWGAPLRHTLLERSGVTPILPNLSEVMGQPMKFDRVGATYFIDIDHVVLNVAVGELERTVSWYEAVLGFKRQQTFSIGTQRSALYSQVMVHPESGVQLPVNEPASPNSQIQEFLEVNRGAGIQHIALTTPHIVKTTQKLRQAGISFLQVPESYYQSLRAQERELPLSAAEWDAIAQAQVLVDCEAERVAKGDDETPLLLQIFTQPIFGQPTFFFELIERRFQAKGFGEGNFRALFEAIEREQLQRMRPPRP